MKTRSNLAIAATALAGLSIASPALAHTGIGGTTGFAAGVAHPLGGLDHVPAMFGVGLFAWMLKGRALWLVPAAFVAMMAVGGALGVFHVPVPMVELGIALSIVVIGALVALGRSMPVAMAMAIAGVFAIFHGHAHGTEMLGTVSGLTYGAGFVAATALLHGLGILAGFGIATASASHGLRVARVGGGVMALAGLAIVGGIL